MLRVGRPISPASDASGFDRWWNVLGIVEIKGENREWLEIRGEEDSLSGWIEKSLIPRGKREMLSAG